MKSLLDGRTTFCPVWRCDKWPWGDCARMAPRGAQGEAWLSPKGWRGLVAWGVIRGEVIWREKTSKKPVSIEPWWLGQIVWVSLSRHNSWKYQGCRERIRCHPGGEVGNGNTEAVWALLGHRAAPGHWKMCLDTQTGLRNLREVGRRGRRRNPIPPGT